MTPSLLAEETLRILSSMVDDGSAPLEVSDARVGLALIQLAAGKEVTALELGNSPCATAESAQRVMSRRMLCPTASHYAVLGVPRTAGGSDIRENYRRLIALVHPDSRPKGLPVDSAIQVNLAYGVLSDPDARARYDASLTDANTATPESSPSPPRSAGAPTGRSNAAHPGRLDGLVSALTARRSLVWMAGLLMLPIVWVLATRSNAPPPTRLVEARPTLQPESEVVVSFDRLAPSGSATSPAAPAPASPGENQSPLALAASRSLTIDSERKLAGSVGAMPAPATTAMAAHPSLTPPETTAVSAAAPTRPRDVARDEAAALRPVLADMPTRDAPPVSGQAVAELLTQLADAVESGSVDRLSELLGDRMPGRANVIADFESVFRSTRKRELRYVRIDQPGQSRPQTFSGVAELGLTAMDGTTSTQRLFLSGAVERRGERVQLARWSSHPVQ